MATYPPVGDRERDAALARIEARHARYDDSRWSEAGTEARDVLGYLRRRRTDLPWQLAADDTWDELVLSAWLWWDERRRERELLHSALARGLSLADVGRFLGITTRQGARDHLDRLDALLADHHRHTTTPRGPAAGDGATDPLRVWAGTTRAARGADLHAARTARQASTQRDRREAWIDAARTRVAADIGHLLHHLHRVGIHPGNIEDEQDADLADFLTWLTEDHTSGTYSPATFATLGLVLGALRHHPAIATQPANHGVRLAIRGADQLRADYAELR